MTNHQKTQKRNHIIKMVRGIKNDKKRMAIAQALSDQIVASNKDERCKCHNCEREI